MLVESTSKRSIKDKYYNIFSYISLCFPILFGLVFRFWKCNLSSAAEQKKSNAIINFLLGCGFIRNFSHKGVREIKERIT